MHGVARTIRLRLHTVTELSPSVTARRSGTELHIFLRTAVPLIHRDETGHAVVDEPLGVPQTRGARVVSFRHLHGCIVPWEADVARLATKKKPGKHSFAGASGTYECPTIAAIDAHVAALTKSMQAIPAWQAGTLAALYEDRDMLLDLRLVKAREVG